MAAGGRALVTFQAADIDCENPWGEHGSYQPTWADFSPTFFASQQKICKPFKNWVVSRRSRSKNHLNMSLTGPNNLVDHVRSINISISSTEVNSLYLCAKIVTRKRPRQYIFWQRICSFVIFLEWGTVDWRNPATVDVVSIPLFTTRLYTSQVVQDTSINSMTQFVFCGLRPFSSYVQQNCCEDFAYNCARTWICLCCFQCNILGDHKSIYYWLRETKKIGLLWTKSCGNRDGV